MSDFQDEERVSKITKGNPGAMDVCFKIIRSAGTDLLDTIEGFSESGNELWLLHKGVCSEGLSKTIKALDAMRARNPSREDIIKSLNNNGKDGFFEKLLLNFKPTGKRRLEKHSALLTNSTHTQ